MSHEECLCRLRSDGNNAIHVPTTPITAQITHTDGSNDQDNAFTEIPNNWIITGCQIPTRPSSKPDNPVHAIQVIVARSRRCTAVVQLSNTDLRRAPSACSISNNMVQKPRVEIT